MMKIRSSEKVWPMKEYSDILDHKTVDADKAIKCKIETDRPTSLRRKSFFYKENLT